MLEVIFEIVVWLLAELVFGPLLELFLEVVVPGDGRIHCSAFTLALILVGGAVAGLASSLVLAERVVAPFIPGARLVLSRLVLGVAMHAFGSWRASRGHTPTLLASSWGGAALGLGTAVGRLAALVG